MHKHRSRRYTPPQSAVACTRHTPWTATARADGLIARVCCPRCARTYELALGVLDELADYAVKNELDARVLNGIVETREILHSESSSA